LGLGWGEKEREKVGIGMGDPRRMAWGKRGNK